MGLSFELRMLDGAIGETCYRDMGNGGKVYQLLSNLRVNVIEPKKKGKYNVASLPLKYLSV